MSSMEQIKGVLDTVLGLNGRAASFDAATPLLGNIPELDSMAVVTVITTLEEQFGIMVDDDEISAETFETLGSLTEFVDRKLAEG
ncbi:acyl carrier protein [Ectothiorhodospira variabilis]|uniref:acyl carrier protein n=1 Tax=Ectothiorhodospira variabilis TaxID=505694 RepID=UPI001EFC0E3B|nr:acyl carrier protein [Ectothiorhodospira variabilis]MCG5494761.1 acyl carrier protein [Ectothiorhodospira variabilis]MCG5504350.1 acyl carrier protein [Ectothiorhodospira variabilis]MCG5507505.1 acyl carrier protein [Ectothiorhodospira variabilis]